MNAFEHYQAGHLREAIAAALEDVKQHPTDGGKRNFLCELLCLVGDLERADRQLEALVQVDPLAQPGVSLFRQLIRAEQARQQFYTDGRLPDFLGQQIPRELAPYLEAAVLLRAGSPAEAATVVAQAEEQRAKLHGSCDGQPFDDLRDLDDLNAAFFEVLTSTGKYFWIPIARVESVEFHPFERPRDLLWRRASMTVRGGPDGEVFLPVLYAGTASSADDALRLGRATEWRGDTGAPVRGAGQRVLLIGNEDRPILELQSLEFDEPKQPVG